jgi:dihydropyrimidinase
MYDLIVKDALLVLTEGTFHTDIAVDKGSVAALLTPGSAAPARRIIDARHHKVLPGLIDAHMHVQAPFQGITGRLSFYQQSLCAAFGGVTTLFDFTNTRRRQSVLQALHERREEMAECAVDYAVHGKFIEASARHCAEIPALIRAGCPTFKLFMTYSREGVMANDATLARIFTLARQHPILPMVHAESDALVEHFYQHKVAAGQLTWRDFAEHKPKLCESEAFQRAVSLATGLGSPLLIVHTTHGECLDIAARSQRRGFPIYVETCPHYLTRFDDLYQDPANGHLAICSPPLRRPEDAAALWQGIKQRVISVTGSDDCAFSREEKERLLQRDAQGNLIQDFRLVVNGVAGMETRLPILLTEGVAAGRITLNQLVAITSTNVARLMGCYPRKGTLLPGSDADMVILDDSERWTLRQQDLHNGCDYSLYEGFQATGRVIATLLRGETIVHRGRFLGNRGQGQYLHRSLDTAIIRHFYPFA